MELRADASQNVEFAKAKRKLVMVTKTGLVRTATRMLKMKLRNPISILLILVFMPIIFILRCALYLALVAGHKKHTADYMWRHT